MNQKATETSKSFLLWDLGFTEYRKCIAYLNMRNSENLRYLSLNILSKKALNKIFSELLKIIIY